MATQKLKKGHVRFLFQVPKHIRVGFKMACTKQGKNMSETLVQFMENYCHSNDTFQDAEEEVVVEEETTALLFEEDH